MDGSLRCAFNDTLWTQCFSRSSTMHLLVLILILSTVTEGLKVIGGNITVVQGETAILPCKLVDTAEPLTQISWQKMTRGKPQNDNFYTILAKNGPQFVNGRDDRFAFVGNFNENDGSLELSNTTLMDEGTYTCIFTLFPSGNHKTEIPLNLLVPPVISLKDDPVTLGDEEVSLVTCTAAGSRPPAEVVWITGTLEESVRITTNYSSHANGTTTTVSSLFGIPTKKINGHSVQCVVTSAARLDKETLNFNIQVFFPPMGVNITEKSQGVFECLTEANPPSTFTWQRISQPMPQSAVKVEGATLQLLSMTSNLNGLYQCEASNPYGSEHSHLYVHVNSGKGRFDLVVGSSQMWRCFCMCLCSVFLYLSLLWMLFDSVISFVSRNLKRKKKRWQQLNFCDKLKLWTPTGKFGHQGLEHFCSNIPPGFLPKGKVNLGHTGDWISHLALECSGLGLGADLAAAACCYCNPEDATEQEEDNGLQTNY